jgi:hypothetical protein
MVIDKAKTELFQLAANKARCAHVILTPDDKRIKVFKKGSSNGFKTSISLGGQTHPIAIEGERLE